MTGTRKWPRVRFAWLVLFAVLAACAVGACGKVGPDRGGLMLIVSQEGALPIGRLDLAVSSNGSVLLAHSYKVPEEAQLPTTIALVSNGDATAQVSITLTAWQVVPGRPDVPLDRRDAIVTQIPADRVAELSVVLSAQCTKWVDGSGQPACTPTGYTCDSATGECVAPQVVATDLPSYQPGDEQGSGGSVGSGGSDSEAGDGNAGGHSNPGGGSSGKGNGAAGKGNGAGGSSGSPGGAGETSVAGSGVGGAGVAGAGVGGAGVGGAGVAGAGAVGGSGGSGGSPPVVRHGKSAGCNLPAPSGDSSTAAVLHEVTITAPLDPVYQDPNGSIYLKHADPTWTYKHRGYGVKLPKNYDQTKAYPIMLGGGGCGGTAKGFAMNPTLGYQTDALGETIQVGIWYLSSCFDDGGSAIDLRTDSPDVPYLKAVVADVEAHYCVDKSLEFIEGNSSGGWEALLGGCAVADVFRASGVVSGGLRQHRAPCNGPQPTIMVEGMTDTTNPIGPVSPPLANIDSAGSAPARDEILVRNGCVAPNFAFTYTDINGNAPHVVWDSTYSKCVTYTGCPKETPVVWCALPGGHQTDTDNGVSYRAGIYKFLSGLPSRP